MSQDDEFGDYLAEALENPEFRKHFERAQRRPAWRRWLIRVWDRRPYWRKK